MQTLTISTTKNTIWNNFAEHLFMNHVILDLNRRLPEEFYWILFLFCVQGNIFWMDIQSFGLYSCQTEPENAETEPIDVKVSESCL